MNVPYGPLCNTKGRLISYQLPEDVLYQRPQDVEKRRPEDTRPNVTS